MALRPKSSLRDAQQRTVTRLYEGSAIQAILSMGAGKTACALTAFAELKTDGYAQEMFVLGPKRVAQLVWPAEPRLWQHLQHLKVIHVVGSAAQRLKALQTPADIYAIGVDNVQWWVEDWLKKQKPERLKRAVLCIDELSRFKNARGKRGKALAPHTGAFLAVWGLTGTPRPNGLEDQFMPMKLLTGGALWGKSFDQWRKKFFYPLDWNGYNWAVQPLAEPQLIADINTVSITIPLEEMPDLPSLNDGPEFIEWVDMPRDVKPVYDKMKKHLVAELVAKGKTVAAANMAVASGKLEQIAQGFLYEQLGDSSATRLHDVKMDALLEMIEGSGGEPVMIAYTFVEDLARLQSEFPGIPYYGSGTTDRQAVEYERMWNERKTPLLAVHPASVGHGLNLQYGGANLFWYGMTWSAELYDQLLKRIHRPGQTRPCFSRPILMRGTVDEIKYDRVRNKMSAQAAFQRFINEV